MSRVRAFCDRVCDKLFEAIDRSPCLNESEKRVLAALWIRCTVRTQTVEQYPGHSVFANEIGLPRRRLAAALTRLETKGFIKATGSATRPRQLAYLLNALILEASYDETVSLNGPP